MSYYGEVDECWIVIVLWIVLIAAYLSECILFCNNCFLLPSELHGNFPLFLHGKKEFLQGNLEYILKEISNYFFIKEIKFIYSGSRKYKGWKICGQSSYRTKKYILSKGIKGTPESITCEVIGINILKSKKIQHRKAFSIFRFFNLYKEYTPLELIIKIIKKLNLWERDK